MKKQIYKNIFLIVFSGILLMTIMLIAKETDLFDDLEDMEAGLKISGGMMLNVVLALALVVLISNVLLIVLNLFRNRRGRIGTMVTVISSLIKYISALVAFCWILSIIGVNVSTIFASVGIFALILGFGAESLVAELVSRLKAAGSECLTLEVRSSNTPAISLYEKLGFLQVGLRKNYYHNPKEDALILRKEWEI